ncbi:hypothetical protein V866_003276 [Kwoniella sp. B9012]|uniref:Uncharacterized protein n=1 Tax=Kwoniella europaea PYCC6329 TaxID=1423913 RepID=A0AAX4KHD2_9TREE
MKFKERRTIAKKRHSSVSVLDWKEDLVEVEEMKRNSYLVNSLFEGVISISGDRENGDEDGTEREKEDGVEDEDGDEDERGVRDKRGRVDENEDEDQDEDQDSPIELDLQDQQYHHQSLSNTIFSSLKDAFSSDEDEDALIPISKHIKDDDDYHNNDNDDDDEDFLPIPISPWFVDLPTKSSPSENISESHKAKIESDSYTKRHIEQQEEMDREQEETRRVYHDLYPPIYHAKKPIPLRDPWRLRSPVQKYHYHYTIC